MIVTIAYTVFILIVGLFTDMTDNKSRKRYLIISSIILILISGLRSYYLGSGDTSRYAGMFLYYSRLPLVEIYETVDRDPIYHIFTVFLTKIFGVNFQLVLICIATIYILCYDRLVYKESPNLLISFIVLFGMNFFMFSMHGIRQGLAIAFIMISYFPLRDKKLIPFLLLVGIGACFHKSALIFVVAYPFCRMGFNKKTLIMYMGFISLMFVFGNTLIREIAMDMSEYDERLMLYAYREKALSLSGFIQLCLFMVLILTKLKTFIQKDKDASILITLLALAIIFQTFAIFIAEMFRVAMYFSTFLIILLPRFLKTYSPDTRRIVTVLLCGALLLYFYSMPFKLEYDFFWND